ILSFTRRFFLMDDGKIMDALLALKWDADIQEEIVKRFLDKASPSIITAVTNIIEAQLRAILLDSETETFDYAIESLYNSVKTEGFKEKVEAIEVKIEDIEESIHAPKNRSVEELPKANVYKRDIEVAREAQALYEYNKKEDIELVEKYRINQTSNSGKELLSPNMVEDRSNIIVRKKEYGNIIADRVTFKKGKGNRSSGQNGVMQEVAEEKLAESAMSAKVELKKQAQKEPKKWREETKNRE
ncbi:18766_t:CDS:2, partial [Gigaspora rosea]